MSYCNNPVYPNLQKNKNFPADYNFCPYCGQKLLRPLSPTFNSSSQFPEINIPKIKAYCGCDCSVCRFGNDNHCRNMFNGCKAD